MNTGKKLCEHLPDVRTREREHRTKVMNQTQHRRQLHAKLQRTADDRSPRCRRSQARQVHTVSKEHERRDDCGVPGDRRCVGNEET